MRNDSGNCYQGCLDPWKINLALARIKAFGFSRDQWADLLQNLVPEVAGFRFCAERAGGRNEAQILYGLINNRLRSVRRSEQRAQLRMERHSQRLGLCSETTEDHALFVTEDHHETQIDVREAVAALPPRERQVCELLMRGSSVREIAQEMGLSWHTVDASIQRIRAQFSEMELNGWLQ